MWAWMAALGVSAHAGIVSPSYAVYRPIRPQALLPKFADYLLRTKGYVSEYVCRSRGIRSSRLRLYPEDFLRLPLVSPPREEQEHVVATIERDTSEIGRAIERAGREIGLIREYRSRLVSDLVTGKLDVRAVTLPSADEAVYGVETSDGAEADEADSAEEVTDADE